MRTPWLTADPCSMCACQTRVLECYILSPEVCLCLLQCILPAVFNIWRGPCACHARIIVAAQICCRHNQASLHWRHVRLSKDGVSPLDRCLRGSCRSCSWNALSLAQIARCFAAAPPQRRAVHCVELSPTLFLVLAWNKLHPDMRALSHRAVCIVKRHPMAVCCPLWYYETCELPFTSFMK